MIKTNQINALRIIDANSNRVREGLRVVEDISRFVLNDKNTALELKKIRHNITNSLKKFNINFIISRDSVKDVGISIKISSESKRTGFIELIKANMQRVEEGLRVLEETTKIVNQKACKKFKYIRFQIYTLEKKIIEKLKPKIDFSLYIIIDRGFIKNKNVRTIINNVVRGNATVIQYRDKISSDIEIINICKYIRNITMRHKIGFIVNDRVDIAVITGADGVHIGKSDMKIKSARQIIGDKIIGITCHTVKESVLAQKNGADYIGFGPIFKTPTKDFLPTPKGINFIKCVKKKVTIPIVAIGGINIDNATSVIKAGADGIATVSAVLGSENIGNSCRKLYSLIKRTKK